MQLRCFYCLLGYSSASGSLFSFWFIYLFYAFRVTLTLYCCFFKSCILHSFSQIIPCCGFCLPSSDVWEREKTASTTWRVARRGSSVTGVAAPGNTSRLSCWIIHPPLILLVLMRLITRLINMYPKCCRATWSARSHCCFSAAPKNKQNKKCCTWPAGGPRSSRHVPGALAVVGLPAGSGKYIYIHNFFLFLFFSVQDINPSLPSSLTSHLLHRCVQLKLSAVSREREREKPSVLSFFLVLFF